MEKVKIFKYKGFRIPEKLVFLTGGGTNDWARISKYHVEMYRRYTPLNPDDFVLEVGCGVGRDAIELTEILSRKGRYVGIDIMKTHIDWCKQNITPKHKNFTFHYYDVKSQIHNSGGTISTSDIRLPAKNNSVDRIVLHSVFTHMYERDIVHYLKEFRRVLKDDGLVLASFFVVDADALESLSRGKAMAHRHAPFSFEHKIGKDCYINDPEFPEGAIGYTPKKINSMLRSAGLGIHGRHIHRGAWSGLKGGNGQDIIVLEKISRLESVTQYSQHLRYTVR